MKCRFCVGRAGDFSPTLTFHEGSDTLAGTRFDLVICSGALHLFEDWREVASSLARRTRRFLYITRLQIVKRAPSFVVRHCSRHYDMEFQAWFLNRGEVFECTLGLGMELVREFVFAENRLVKNAPEKSECQGFYSALGNERQWISTAPQPGRRLREEDHKLDLTRQVATGDPRAHRIATL